MHKNLIKLNNKNRVKMGKGNRHFFQRQNPNRQQVHEKMLNITNYYVLYCSVVQSCLTLWDPLGCGRPGFPVHLEFAQIHVH